VNILEDFLKQAAGNPERIAVIDAKGAFSSYGVIEDRSSRLAARWSEAGIGIGDRVLVALSVDADLYASLAALWSLGAVAVLPEPALGLRGLRQAVEATSPKAFLANGSYRVLRWANPSIRRMVQLRVDPATSRGHAIADLDSEAHALISFTSGSSGTPKAIARSHGFLAAQNRAVAPLLASERPSIDLVAFPVFVVAALGRGDTSVLPNWKLGRPADADPAAIRRHCVAHRVDRMLLSPAIVRLLASRGAPAGVHTIFVGGGPVFVDVVDEIVTASGDLRVVAVYGSTEAEPIAHCELGSLDDARHDAMSNGAGLIAGTPAPGTALRIVDDEIQVAGDHVVKGYLDPARDVSTKVRDADGTTWHRTGDAGRIDDDGVLWLLGRVDGRVAGLWPFAVETRARSWKGVREAALVEMDGMAVLAIVGDRSERSRWQREFEAMGGWQARRVGRIPVDRRHGSKVDVAALRILLS